jgi:hypothetical protein
MGDAFQPSLPHPRISAPACFAAPSHTWSLFSDFGRLYELDFSVNIFGALSKAMLMLCSRRDSAI